MWELLYGFPPPVSGETVFGCVRIASWLFPNLCEESLGFFVSSPSEIAHMRSVHSGCQCFITRACAIETEPAVPVILGLRSIAKLALCLRLLQFYN